jgi:hypothetical protein
MRQRLEFILKALNISSQAIEGVDSQEASNADH